MTNIKKAYPLNEYYSKIYRRYDLVNLIFTLGQDGRWRKETAQLCLVNNSEKVLDLCCGTGELAITLATKSHGKTSVTGYDRNQQMLLVAKQKAEKQKLVNIDFIQGDAGLMPFLNQYFDCITIGFGFRNLTFENPNADIHLNEIQRVLKPGGKLLILESGVPKNLLIRFFFRLYLKLILIPIGGLLSGDWRSYKYLAKSASNFYSIPEIKNLLSNKGLAFSFVKQYMLGATNLIVVIKK